MLFNFFPTHHEFQDLGSRKIIGTTKECAGLHHFKIDDSLEEQTQPASFAPTLIRKSNRIFKVLVPIMIMQSCYSTID